MDDIFELGEKCINAQKEFFERVAKERKRVNDAHCENIRRLEASYLERPWNRKPIILEDYTTKKCPMLAAQEECAEFYLGLNENDK